MEIRNDNNFARAFILFLGLVNTKLTNKIQIQKVNPH